jgi:DNA-binding response OmpR family regulator
MKILVVEDEPVSCAVLVKILSSQPGTQVTTVETGDAAWALLDDPGRYFDLVFLDIALPGVDGLELLRRIRNSALHTRTRVVMCTAASDRDTVTKAIALGVRHYLVKPLKEAAVAAKIADLTPRPTGGPERQLAGV